MEIRISEVQRRGPARLDTQVRGILLVSRNARASKSERAAAFNVEGDALKWLRYQRAEAPIHSWSELCKLVTSPFYPRAACTNHLSSFARVRQKTTVEAYIKEFEELANRVQGFSSQFKVETFISGLKTEIRQEIEQFYPTTMLEAKNRASSDARAKNHTRKARL